MRWPWQKPKEEKPKECNHKYKDFPWYVETTHWSGSRECEVKVVEPFVCVLCKQRKNVVLQTLTRNNYCWKDALKFSARIEKEYEQYCKPRPVVEDMIADMQLIDREFLKYYDLIHDTENSVPKIELPKDPNKVSVDQLTQWIMARHGIEPYASHFKDVHGWEVHTIKPLTKEEIE